MPVILLPNALTRRFAYGFEESLYTDFRNFRVTMDVEGAGNYTVLQPTTDFVVESDATESVDMQGQFTNYATLLTNLPSEVWVANHAGPYPQPRSVKDRCEGRGWLFSASGAVEIDDSKEVLVCENAPYPIPFFRKVTGENLVCAVEGPPVNCVDSFDLSDTPALKQRKWVAKNASKLRELTSTFPNQTPHTGAVLCHLNSMNWISPTQGCQNLIVRRLGDRFHGRQRVRVHANGELMGGWYEPAQDRRHRWSWTQFGFTLSEPSEFVRISLEPPAGSPLFSVSQIEIWGW